VSVTGCRFPLVRAVIGVIVLAAFVGLSIRAIHFASVPPFEPASPLAAGPRIELRGVAFTRQTPRGRLEVRVERICPGHRRVGYFMLGPSTHLALEQVSVRCQSDPATSPVPAWMARGRRARLQGEVLYFASRCTWIEPPGSPRLRNDLRIDLRTGSVSASR
jgi:hypothetical protein